jgi:peroxiredoxin
MKYFILLAVALVLGSCKPQPGPKDAPADSMQASKARLPAIDIVTVDGDSIKLSAVKGQSVIILFTPDCDHCEREADDIGKHLDLFKDYTLYFVASQNADIIKGFAVKHGINDKPNIVFAQAAIVPVVTLLEPTSMPTIFIYDSKGMLVKRFDGETDVEDIAAFL